MGGYCEFRKIETNYLLYIEWDYFNLPEGVKHGDKVTIKANVKDVKLMFSESSSITQTMGSKTNRLNKIIF